MQPNRRCGPAQVLAPKLITSNNRVKACYFAGTKSLAAATMVAQVLAQHEPPPNLANVNGQRRVGESKSKRQYFDAINRERRKQIAEFSEKLLTLAIALKAEVDSNPVLRPSGNKIRKAEGIEKLARNVKQTMGLAIGPN
jgi:Skp family chaperone for outer membrane proteins